MADIRNTKLICTDMDGTLFAGHELIPEINKQALRECMNRGIYVALVSGRNFRFLGDSARLVSDDIIIVSSNGVRIDSKPGGECLFESMFNTEDARRVNEVLWQIGLYYEIYTSNGNFALRDEIMPEKHRDSLRRYLEKKQIPVCRFCNSPDEVDLGEINKFVLFTDDESEILRARRILDANGLEHSSSWADNIEIMPPGINKGAAVKRLADILGISVEDVTVFGDYSNDLSMLKAAGHPVAMGNAVDELKAAAEIIAPVNTEGGVGQVIKKYILGT